MAQYTQMVLDYLEHSDPKFYEHLREEKMLLETARALATEMAGETARIHEQLKANLPDEYALFQAEMLVVDEFLPTTPIPIEDMKSRTLHEARMGGSPVPHDLFITETLDMDEL